MTRLEIYLLAALVLLGALAGSYWYGRHDGGAIAAAKYEQEKKEAVQIALASLTDAVNKSAQNGQLVAEELAKNRGSRIIDRGVIQREITTNTVYGRDCLPASGLMQWNQLNAGVPLLPGGAAGSGVGEGVPKGNGAAGPGREGRHITPKPSGRQDVVR